jgi:bifunctional DNA primase/polymerase-like protein/primase-like protein
MTAQRAAERWAARRCPVLPVNAAKRPYTANGLLDATLDADVIRGWFRRWPDANVAVRTGVASRLVVIDVDGDQGADALHALERRHGSLPTTASVRTPRGGAHYYLRHPGPPVRTSAGALGAGVDVRGDGGYVVTPPSIGANGRRYKWDEEAPPASMPAWLVDATRPDRPADARRRAEPASTWVRMVHSGLAEGERNTGMARLIGHLLARDVDVRLAGALAHLVNTRCRPPLDPEEVDRVIASIAGREVTSRTRRAA